MNKSWRTLYPDLRRMREERWTKLAKAYEKNPEGFYESWHWLQCHPIFWYFGTGRQHESTLCSNRGVYEGLELCPELVDPKTRRTEGPLESRVVEIWVEVFPASMGPGGRSGIRLHDYVCDTGAPTYEEAVIKTARLVYERHGHDRVKLDEIWDGS